MSGTSATFIANINADDYSLAAWKILDWAGSVAQIGGINSGQWNAIDFFTSGSNKMRLDALGNLGLGVTPSAWTARALQGPASFSIGNSGDSGLNLLSNAFFGSSWTYIETAPASWYQQIAGQHRWYAAPSGTAGNAISFTPVMTLDASGRLGIGTTSPVVSLHIENTNTSTSPFGNVISTFRSQASGTDINLQFSDGATQAYIGSISGSLYFGTAGSNERLRITSSGNVGIGTTSPSERLHVEGITRVSNSDAGTTMNFHPNADFGAGALPTIQVLSNHALQFATNNNLRLTIASTGAATFSSSVTATSFIRSGGTSSQFLKADGSVDSSTFAKSAQSDTTVWRGTQAEYDAIPTKSSTTIYFIQ